MVEQRLNITDSPNREKAGYLKPDFHDGYIYDNRWGKEEDWRSLNEKRIARTNTNYNTQINALFGHAFEEIIWGHIGDVQESFTDYLEDCKLETVENITFFYPQG